MVAALRKGGHVLYIRHASTAGSKADQHPVDYLDRDTQRNLSELGVEQSKQIGAAIRRLGIPVAPTILSSPYCRCMETSLLAFGRAIPTGDLAFAIKLNETETIQRAEFLRERLAETPPEGTNTVLVAHTANLKEAADVWPKPEGVTMIFKPLPEGRFKLIRRYTADEWVALAEWYGTENKSSLAASQPAPSRDISHINVVDVKCQEETHLKAQH